MENIRENVIKLLRAMIKNKRELAGMLDDKHRTFANTLWNEQNALATAVDILEDQSYFDSYAEIYFDDNEKEDENNG
jgi:hypothetical protein